MFSLSIVDINTLAWIMVAVVNLLTAYLAWQASRAMKVTNASMLQVVHATDGMKAVSYTHLDVYKRQHW